MTPSGVTGWSRTRNRDGTRSRRSPVVCGRAGTLRLRAGHAWDRPSWACPGSGSDSDPVTGFRSDTDPARVAGSRPAARRPATGTARTRRRRRVMPRFMRALPKNRGETRWAPGAEMRGLPRPGTDRDVDGCGPWGAGHGPVRHDHRPGDAADDGMWSGRRASNSRPQAWEAGALPTELRPHGAHCTMISVRLPSCTVASRPRPPPVHPTGGYGRHRPHPRSVAGQKAACRQICNTLPTMVGPPGGA